LEKKREGINKNNAAVCGHGLPGKSIQLLIFFYPGAADMQVGRDSA
jgi:hypothetical protein